MDCTDKEQIRGLVKESIKKTYNESLGENRTLTEQRMDTQEIVDIYKHMFNTNISTASDREIALFFDVMMYTENYGTQHPGLMDAIYSELDGIGFADMTNTTLDVVEQIKQRGGIEEFADMLNYTSASDIEQFSMISDLF